MKRRTFIKLSTLTPIIVNSYMMAKDVDDTIWTTILEVQNILFPKTSKMPSAKEFGSVAYLKQNIDHYSFDKDDLELILNAAQVFKETFSEFFKATKDEKLEIIKQANGSEYGSSWINILVYYGIEAMLSDPIYGGNKFQSGWMALNHKPGIPRPKRKYGAKVDV
ncbi:gluconate 2-dehydrogenase subunit 3 family protein [Arcobacter sp. KX21116]|uniref:gluconate 2-dehydrogenase subunit 3 family protein n=1 Tax=Arcobacter iocasae TaxID=2906515 RepID=UPI0035D4A19F